MSQES